MKKRVFLTDLLLIPLILVLCSFTYLPADSAPEQTAVPDMTPEPGSAAPRRPARRAEAREEELDWTEEDHYWFVQSQAILWGEQEASAAADEPLSAEEIIYRYLIDEMGLNTAAACGILANIKSESNFDYTASGDNGHAYGLCQWNGIRALKLHEYCSSEELGSTSIEGQLAFLHYELETLFPDTWKKLQTVTNDAAGAYEAAYCFCINYEAPQNTEAAATLRGTIARNAFWPVWSGEG